MSTRPATAPPGAPAGPETADPTTGSSQPDAAGPGTPKLNLDPPPAPPEPPAPSSPPGPRPTRAQLRDLEVQDATRRLNDLLQETGTRMICERVARLGPNGGIVFTDLFTLVSQ
jgi:hypothetical protein